MTRLRFAAVDAEVCSVYLVDRDASGVTLAATNGMDTSQVGSARLPMGGITGRVAASGRRIVSLNVRRDRRFTWQPPTEDPDRPRVRSGPRLPLWHGGGSVRRPNAMTGNSTFVSLSGCTGS